jgi:beta-glucoside operon transcriptional antiterminator
MRVIKKINNNVALCLDNSGNEVVAFGKGIGFRQPPYEVPLSLIKRTYYSINPIYLEMVNDIPLEVFETSAKIVDYGRTKLSNLSNSNIVFTLADHINFAIRRYKENMMVSLPIIYDIQYLFDIEMSIGNKALDIIENNLHYRLPNEEAAYIALQFINAEGFENDSNSQHTNEVIVQQVTSIIESNIGITIDKNSKNYSRFVTHLYYLLKSGNRKKTTENKYDDMYRSLISSWPKIYACTSEIREYLNDVLSWNLTNEECIYLMLHINRLCDREGCYQSGITSQSH